MKDFFSKIFNETATQVVAAVGVAALLYFATSDNDSKKSSQNKVQEMVESAQKADLSQNQVGKVQTPTTAEVPFRQSRNTFIPREFAPEQVEKPSTNNQIIAPPTVVNLPSSRSAKRKARRRSQERSRRESNPIARTSPTNASSESPVPFIFNCNGVDCVTEVDDPNNPNNDDGSENVITDDPTEDAPSIVNIDSSKTDGSYTTGEVIQITVEFDRGISSGDGSALSLNTGGTASFVSFSGTTATYTYTVSSGENIDDLNVISFGSGTSGASTDLPSGENLADNKELRIDTTAPSVVEVTSSTADGSYNAGDVISIEVKFNEVVNVTGTPQITLNSPSTVVNYSSGSGSDTLVFSYTVGGADASTDLDYVATTSLDLNGGDIEDLVALDADLTLASPGATGSIADDKAIVIDNTPATVVQVYSNTADGNYAIGEIVNIDVEFDEVVNVTGTPQLTLETGTTDAVVNYSSGSGTNTLRFVYTVGAGDVSADLDYVGTTSLALNGGAIDDNAGNVSDLTLATPNAANSISDDKAIIIDGEQPTITDVAAPTTTDGYYTTGQSIDIVVTFSEPVTVTGTPELTLSHGPSISYSSGSPGTTLTFTYTIAVPENSPALEYANTTALALNSGSIKDAFGNDAVLTLPATGGSGSISDNQSIIIDTDLAQVVEVRSPTADNTYGVGAIIDIEVVFDDLVDVNTGGGTPTIALNSGATVSYSGGTGTNTLQFQYTVGGSESSTDLDYSSTAALILNGGTILKSGAGTPATLTLATPGTTNSISDDKAIVIDSTGPTVTQVYTLKSDATYGVGESIDILVEFDEIVTVTTGGGTPTLALNSGETINYTSGSGSNTLTFNYIVQAGNNSSDLDYSLTNSLTLNGGTINDAVGNAADLTLATPGAAYSISDDKAIVIDTTGPTVTEVLTYKLDGTYGTGEIINILVVFDEDVVVSGTPQITLNTGAVVNYTTLAGTNTMSFAYSVSPGENTGDLDHDNTTALVLNGGTIQDAMTNNADLTLPAPGGVGSIADDKAVVIDTNGPTVTAVSSAKPDGSYDAGEVIDIVVDFSENVSLSGGMPYLELNSGANAYYLSGNGSSSFTFRYTVGAGENSTDLDYVATTSFNLNGSAIKDFIGNDADLTLPTPNALNSISDDKAIVIDNVVPTVTQVYTLKADGTYTSGEVIDILVEFSEIVYVTGNPRISLNSGTTVDYLSGDGTNTLIFQYTVAAPDYSIDLDYTSTAALVLNGGTIPDAADLDADLALVTPNSVNSISDDKAIIIDTTGPTVNQVYSFKPNGTYGAGEAIDIFVEFNEVVIVGGFPQLTLNSGATVSYTSGSGSNTLLFQYTVSVGESSSDLDYSNTTALNLSGGTIQDLAANNADLSLAFPGFFNSISDDKAIIIDAIQPVVIDVRTAKADGIYGVGEVIDIIVEFDKVVTFTGTPVLSLDSGGTASYQTAAPATTATFRYTVGGGENSSDLDYVNTGSLALSGGTIQDAFGNNADLTLATPNAVNSISDDKAIIIDTTAPTVTEVYSNKADATYGIGEVIDIRVEFNEVVYVNTGGGTPSIALNSGATVNYTSGHGTDTLLFSYTVGASENSTDLDYSTINSLVLNSGTIRDVANNDAD